MRRGEGSPFRFGSGRNHTESDAVGPSSPRPERHGAASGEFRVVGYEGEETERGFTVCRRG